MRPKDVSNYIDVIHSLRICVEVHMAVTGGDSDPRTSVLNAEDRSVGGPNGMPQRNRLSGLTGGLTARRTLPTSDASLLGRSQPQLNGLAPSRYVLS